MCLSYLVVRISPLKEIDDQNAWNRLKSVQRKWYRDIFAVERGDDFTVYISWLHFNGSRKYMRPSENQATNKGTFLFCT